MYFAPENAKTKEKEHSGMGIVIGVCTDDDAECCTHP